MKTNHLYPLKYFEKQSCIRDSPVDTFEKRGTPWEMQGGGQSACLQGWQWHYDLKKQLPTPAAAESKFQAWERWISAQLRQSYMLSISKLAAQWNTNLY